MQLTYAAYIIGTNTLYGILSPFSFPRIFIAVKELSVLIKNDMQAITRGNGV